MSKILLMGPPGGGKSTSLGKVPEHNIEGLNPKETFIIACSNKGLPFRGWRRDYPKEMCRIDKGIVVEMKGEGNYYQTNEAMSVANIIKIIGNSRPEIKNIVIDDSNYLMQDYYMDNSLKGGYDTFKKIGLFMGKVFAAIESFDALEKNIIMVAHYEEYKAKNNDVISYRYKTVGNMVQNYITPEGKFEIVLFALQEENESTKTIHKWFITNFDGEFPAKTPVGMFKQNRIPNDMGYVLKAVDAYNMGEQQPALAGEQQEEQPQQ